MINFLNCKLFPIISVFFPYFKRIGYVPKSHLFFSDLACFNSKEHLLRFSKGLALRTELDTDKLIQVAFYTF
jgi:hypothetical protein